MTSRLQSHMEPASRLYAVRAIHQDAMLSKSRYLQYQGQGYVENGLLFAFVETAVAIFP